MTWRYQAPELLTQASCSRSKLSLVPVESYPVKFLIVAQSGRFSFGQQRFLHADVYGFITLVISYSSKHLD